MDHASSASDERWLQHRLDPFIIAVAAVFGLSLLWPVDISWINDQPHLIRNALDANSRGELAKSGLLGSVGVRYGPLQTWFYQICLLCTSNLVLISQFKNVLLFALDFAVLLAIARELNLNRWPILILFVSPSAYFVRRAIWDAGFMVAGIAALALVLLWMGRRPTVKIAYVGLALTVMLFALHVKCFAVIAAFLICFGIAYRSWLRKHYLKVLPGIICAAGFALWYAHFLAADIEYSSVYRTGIVQTLAGLFGGPRLFSVLGQQAILPHEMSSVAFPLPPFVTTVLRWCTGLSFVGVYLGAAIGLYRAWSLRRRGRALEPQDLVTVFCVLTIVFYGVFFVATGHGYFAHYTWAIWIAHFMLLWQCLAALPVRVRRACLGIHLGSLSVLQIAIILFIHINGGTRGPYYGATLANQIEVAQRLSRYSSESQLIVHVKNYQHFFHALTTLVSLYQMPTDKAKPIARLMLDYANPDDPVSGWITLIELPPEPD